MKKFRVLWLTALFLWTLATLVNAAEVTVTGQGASERDALHDAMRTAIEQEVGVLVEYTGGDEALVHQVAMHIAAMSPVYVSRDEVPAEVVENERRIAEATAREEGKPEGAIPRIIEGRLGGFYKDVVLLDQPAVWEDKKTVGDVLKAAGVEIKRFARLAVGA